MSISRKYLICLLLTLVFLIGVSSTFAASPTITHQSVHYTASFTLTPEQCPNLQVPVSGTGQGSDEIITTVNSDGSTRTDTASLITGTATDSTGTYRFVYHNHNIIDVSASGSVQVFMVDSFTLNGNGSAGNYEVSFTWRWTAPSLETAWPPHDNWQQISTVGDPLHCDPL
jgi:hypothetical protein